MATHTIIVPFIKKWEGQYVNDPLDRGGETMQGITYAVWCSVFGTNSHDRFMKMSESDWSDIYKKLYWDKILGDKINSQRIANTMADWVWGSGHVYPVKNLQIIVKAKQDGLLGNGTIAALNAFDEPTVYKQLIDARYKFLEKIVLKNPSQKRFIAGWNNRMNALVKFNA